MNIHRSSCTAWWENYLTRHSAVRLQTPLFMNAAAASANLCGLSVVGSDETALSPSCSQRLALSHPIPQRHALNHVTTRCSVLDTATQYFRTPKENNLKFSQKTKGSFSHKSSTVMVNLFGIEKELPIQISGQIPKRTAPLRIWACRMI